jgi:hypothetical protein
MGWRMSWTGRIGLALVLIGIGLPFAWERWVATRTWVPLNIPISLAPGHVKTPEFEINLESSFWVSIEVERKFDYAGVPCLLAFGAELECKNRPGVVGISWLLSDGGKEIAHGHSDSDHAVI